jgi:hypothetical protein
MAVRTPAYNALLDCGEVMNSRLNQLMNTIEIVAGSMFFWAAISAASAGISSALSSESANPQTATTLGWTISARAYRTALLVRSSSGSAVFNVVSRLGRRFSQDDDQFI